MRENSMKKHLFIATILIVPFLFGCSYSKIDNTLQEKINDELNSTVTMDDENGITRDVDDTPINYEGITYVGIGDSISDYYCYTDQFGEINKFGINGLTYTLKKVSVYDSINNSSITPEMCKYIDFGDSFNEMTKFNSFIVAEMSASYNKSSENDDDAVQPIFEFDATYHIGDPFKDFHPSTETDKPDKENYVSIEPYIVYFSEQPQSGDKDKNGNNISEKSANWFRAILKDGETVDFKIGIICSPDLIEDKNVFLAHRFQTSPSDEPVYQFDLLGGIINEKNAQN